MMNKILFLTFGLVWMARNAAAQPSIYYPDVGDQAPPFTLNNVRFYDKKVVTAGELKGRHIILDFFSAGCTACFESLPKVNRIQNDNKPGLQIFMVGNDTYGLSNTYLRFREKRRLQLPVSYDSLVLKQFSVAGVPYLVWIDDKGKIKAITGSLEITQQNVSAFLADKPFPARNLNVKREKAAVLNQDSAYIFGLRRYADQGSLTAGTFVAWDPTMPLEEDNITSYRYVGGNAYLQFMGVSVSQLINWAYTGHRQIIPPDSAYGKLFTNPIYEMDSADMPIANLNTGRGMFCYSMITDSALATPATLEESLRGDLKTRLGYDVNEEMRMMPCWVVTAQLGTAEKLRTKSDSVKSWGTTSGWHVRRYPSYIITGLLSGIDQQSPPFIDETGLTGAIDLDIEALITDFDDVKKALEKYGIVVTPGRRLMEVLVVRKSARYHSGGSW